MPRSSSVGLNLGTGRFALGPFAPAAARMVVQQWPHSDLPSPRLPVRDGVTGLLLRPEHRCWRGRDKKRPQRQKSVKIPLLWTAHMPSVKRDAPSDWSTAPERTVGSCACFAGASRGAGLGQRVAARPVGNARRCGLVRWGVWSRGGGGGGGYRWLRRWREGLRTQITEWVQWDWSFSEIPDGTVLKRVSRPMDPRIDQSIHCLSPDDSGYCRCKWFSM